MKGNHGKKKRWRDWEHVRGRSDLSEWDKSSQKSKNSTCIQLCEEGSGGNLDTIECNDKKSQNVEERVEGRGRDGVESNY